MGHFNLDNFVCNKTMQRRSGSPCQLQKPTSTSFSAVFSALILFLPPISPGIVPLAAGTSVPALVASASGAARRSSLLSTCLATFWLGRGFTFQSAIRDRRAPQRRRRRRRRRERNRERRRRRGQRRLRFQKISIAKWYINKHEFRGRRNQHLYSCRVLLNHPPSTSHLTPEREGRDRKGRGATEPATLLLHDN